MADKDPHSVRFITVKPADKDGTDSAPKIYKTDNAETNKYGGIVCSMSFPCNQPEMSVHVAQIAEFDSAFREVEIQFAKDIEDSLKANEETAADIKQEVAANLEVAEKHDEFSKKERKKKVEKNGILPVDVTRFVEEKTDQLVREMNDGEPHIRNEKNKKKKKKEKKKKKKKKGKEEVATDVQPVESKKKPPKKLDPIEPAPLKEEDEEHVADDKKKKSKLPGCFGFISTWLAKRKEKRRDKKRKAIENRNNPPSLVQNEHKKAKGGEAFVIEVDCRPIVKMPLLPPIKRTSGPIRRGTYGQLQTVEERRLDELARRRAAAATYERKKSACKARKSELENQFRKKTDLCIRCKQADAERSRNSQSRRKIKPIRPASIQSSSCESMSIEGDVSAFIQDEDSDQDAWKVDDVDIFCY